MKGNGEGKKITPSFFVGEHQINAKEGDVVHDDKVYFVSHPKQEQISDRKSSFELSNEVEDKLPPTGCELGKLKEKNLMQRDEHISEFGTPFQHDEEKITRHEMI